MTISAADFAFVQTLVRESAAIVLEPGKEYLAESRLAPLARAEGCTSIAELVSRARNTSHPALRTKLVELMTTNETSFFRDVHPFETLRKLVLPELLRAREKDKTLNLWCAAASSGQEPYTIAFVLRESFPELATWRVRFLASDISGEMLRRCREGRFSQLEVNRGLPAKLLIKYFDKVGADWQLRPDMRASIEFLEINLAKPWPTLPALDVVFMRNVLIYFDTSTKREILGRVRKTMRPDGCLFLGGSETTLNLDESFRRVAQEKSCYYRIQS